MNGFAHIFLNFAILSLILPNAKLFLIPIIIFSVIVDLDHILGYISEYREKKKDRVIENLGPHTLKETMLVRSIIQEPIGIFILCILIYVFYLIDVVKPIIALIAILCLVLHWTLDFLTNITLPFRPFNMKVVNLFFKTKKSWIIKEFVLTFIFAILFGLAYFVF